jgi:hypothetical protein
VSRDELCRWLAAVMRSHARLMWLYGLLYEALRPPLGPGDEGAPNWARVGGPGRPKA